MCLGALLGYPHFHAGLDTWKMNESIPERGGKRLSILPLSQLLDPQEKAGVGTRELLSSVSQELKFRGRREGGKSVLVV